MATANRYVAIYARVSSNRQDHRSQLPDLQRWADGQSLPVKMFRDKFSGKTMNRPAWDKLEADIRAGKVAKVVCWKLDRLGRTARGLLGLFDVLRQTKTDLICTNGGISGLETPEGRLLAGILAQVAEFDNEVRSERIRAGQAAAREQGKTWGGSEAGWQRKDTGAKVRAVKTMAAQGESITSIAKALKVSRQTVYNLMSK